MKRCVGIVLALLCFCGCGRTERIAHQTIVTALEASPTETGWRLSAEYLQPTPPDQPASYGVLTGEGEELHLALSAMERQSGMSLYLGNCRILLALCPLESQTFQQLLEEADKSLELRPTVPVAVISQAVLTSEKATDFFVGGEGNRFCANNRRTEEGRMTLKDHLNTLRDPARCAASVVLGLEEEQFLRQGTVFWGREEGSFLPWEEQQLLPLSITGRGERWALLEEAEQEVEIVSLNGHIQWNFTETQPSVTIFLRCRGTLRWSAEGEGTLEQGEKELSRLLEEQGRQLWEQLTQEEGIDFLDTGKALSWQKPDLWKMVEENWPEELKKIPCQFVAETVLSDPSGLLEGEKSAISFQLVA